MGKIGDAVNRNPFPGLRPFQEREQHLFFGRERQVDAMVDKLGKNRFLSVVGSSGSGKSSLVNCGLKPALRSGLMAAAGTAWRMVYLRPGADPLASLARGLAENGVLFRNFNETGMPLVDIVDTNLRISNLGIVDVVDQARLADGVNVLVIVDQFEELFRYQALDNESRDSVRSRSERGTAFVNLLLSATSQSRLPIYVVMTMRSDFFGECAQFHGLAEAINAGQYLVPRLTRKQRRDAIRSPIAVAGGKISPVLLTRLVNDVGDNPDQLSILQHALNRTWAHWQQEGGGRGELALSHYEAIGSMARALDQHAERAFAELPSPRAKKICEDIFKALTDKATDSRGVRRPTRLENLCHLTNADPAEVIQVIDVFRKSSRSFLMPPADVELQRDTVIDISHESLMRVWQRLQHWAFDEADSARMYMRLTETAALYRDGKAGLWRDPDLGLALQWRNRAKPNGFWANQYQGGFDDAMGFLRMSEKSEARRLAYRQYTFAGLFVLLMGLLGYFYYQQGKELELEEERRALEGEKLQLTEKLLELERESLKIATMQSEESPAEQESLAQMQIEIEARKIALTTERDDLETNAELNAVTVTERAGAIDDDRQPDGDGKRDNAQGSDELAPSTVVNIRSPDSGSAFSDIGHVLTDDFGTYEQVRNLEPVNSLALFERQSRVYIFAKLLVASELGAQPIMLDWYIEIDGKWKAFSDSKFNTVRYNPQGYRVFSYRTIDRAGEYRACFKDAQGKLLAIKTQSGGEQKPGCVKFSVVAGK